MEAYDPLTDTWTQKADMPTSRASLSTVAVAGKIYAIGGAQIGTGKGLSTVEVYDAATDTWTQKADMPTPRAALSTSVVARKIYAIGGIEIGAQAKALPTVEAYNPATDTWTRMADMPTPRGRLSYTASVVNGMVYVIGGSSTGGNAGLSTVEVYNPATDTWTTEVGMPTPRVYMSTPVVEGIIYAIGGAATSSYGQAFATVEAFIPESVTAVSLQGKLATTWATIKQNR